MKKNCLYLLFRLVIIWLNSKRYDLLIKVKKEEIYKKLLKLFVWNHSSFYIQLPNPKKNQLKYTVLNFSRLLRCFHHNLISLLIFHSTLLMWFSGLVIKIVSKFNLDLGILKKLTLCPSWKCWRQLLHWRSWSRRQKRLFWCLVLKNQVRQLYVTIYVVMS